MPQAEADEIPALFADNVEALLGTDEARRRRAAMAQSLPEHSAALRPS